MRVRVTAQELVALKSGERVFPGTTAVIDWAEAQTLLLGGLISVQSSHPAPEAAADADLPEIPPDGL